ncbi:hypothetical protein CR513_50209, partial [Mucuna pruriens]
MELHVLTIAPVRRRLLVQFRNQSNFPKVLKLPTSYNEEINELVLENVLEMQDTLHPLFKRKFYILCYEACGEYKREQMTPVVRFVDNNEYVKRHFLNAIHVQNIQYCLLAISTFKNFKVKDTMKLEICVKNIMIYKL